MRRTCARPGCAETASSTLSYDYRERSVWLGSLSDEPHPMLHDLCDDHAGSLSVPRGWTLLDRRPGSIGALPFRRTMSA